MIDCTTVLFFILCFALERNLAVSLNLIIFYKCSISTFSDLPSKQRTSCIGVCVYSKSVKRYHKLIFISTELIDIRKFHCEFLSRINLVSITNSKLIAIEC